MTQESNPRRVIVEGSAEEATRAALEIVKTTLCDAVGRFGACRMALAGGTTPHGLYQMLAREAVTGDVPWGNVEVFFGDERDVPHDHADSNYRMVQRALLDHVPIRPERVHPMPADCEDLDEAAADYERTIRNTVPAGEDGIPRFELILLGMGGDGHTASLFPGTWAVEETEKLVVSQFVPVLGRNRLTFTFPLINAARTVIMLVTGEDKAQAVGALLSDCPVTKDSLPAARVRPTDGLLAVVLDSAAGRQERLKP